MVISVFVLHQRYPSVDEIALDRVVRQIRVAGHLHLLENARTVGAHRLDAEAQFLCDLRRTLSLREPAEDLELALRKRAVQRTAAA